MYTCKQTTQLFTIKRQLYSFMLYMVTLDCIHGLHTFVPIYILMILTSMLFGRVCMSGYD